ncbi:methyltransferase family protein [Streptomyces sp. Ag109_O5-1]|uniref:class I SAM-dependent methyltransferase n=1 Tax=Streptomyces sp. Ag109_O5-1 TaxID=1938851 RepID=UPI000F4E989F|nr:class I SAM-dependent methyltransferase [Streptomyces sp. Ag109_O5-1]RPE27051.1 methyltransferase family protein [Streptomyces sp. Ag109_O5-1]
MTTDEDESYGADEDPYAMALQPGRRLVYLRQVDGRRIRMPVHRWHEQPTEADKTVLERCIGPVLDVGCGPGRMCRALLSRGVFALGVDIAPRAIALTTALGGLALCRSVFDRLPAETGWQTVLLIDGNIGIGGDPRGLLRRCGRLIAPAGRLVVEVDPRDVEELCTVRFEDLQGRSGPFFPWARLGRQALHRVAEDLAFSVADQWTSGHRCFAALTHQGSASDCPDVESS